MDSITFRQAVATDTEAVWALWHACIQDESSCWTCAYPTREILQNDLDHGWLYLYLERGELVGTISLLSTDGLSAFALPFQQTALPRSFTRICVSPPLQGRHLGRKVLRCCETEAARAGTTALHLLCDIHNQKARALFHHAGYLTAGEFTLEGEQFWAMEKSL